jgi:hypothetical protein
LAWDQVVDFRRDTEAKIKLRRLRNWLSNEFVGKPISYVSDAIAIKLDDYEWATKKHGISVVSGTVSNLLDSKFIATTAPVVGALWAGAGSGLAELAAAGLLIGKVAVSLTDKLVDLKDRKRGQGSEVAFVHEIKKLTDK